MTLTERISTAPLKANALTSESVDTGLMLANNVWWSDADVAFIGVADAGYAREPARIASTEAQLA